MLGKFNPLEKCLCCKNKDLHQLISLGHQPLANSLLNDADESFETYPLEVNYCNQCFHMQLTGYMDPTILYTNYVYLSGVSDTGNSYFNHLSQEIFNKIRKTGKSIAILDIAANDGSFLEKFLKYNWSLYGVDPASNLRSLCEKKGINVTTNFFGFKDVILEFPTKFDVITALNVLGHSAFPLEFLKQCKKLLKEDGFVFVQTSQRDMVLNCQFDTIYHEHISYFSIRSMKYLASEAGLAVNSICFPAIHGGSYLFCLQIKSTSQDQNWEHLETPGRYNISTYTEFSTYVQKLKSKIIHFLEEMGNIKLIGFGAAAKGLVMLHFLSMHKIAYIVDENPLKIDRIVPGLSVPIYSPETLSTDKDPICVIVLAWNFFDEIYKKIKELRPTYLTKIVQFFPELKMTD